MRAPDDATFASIGRTIRGQIAALDGVRGLAILLVLVHNAGGPDGPSTGLALKLFDITTNVGWIGVQLFFVLSGFLITGILLDTRGAPKAWSAFYMRRLLRIFPLYYAALVIAFFVAPLVTGHVRAGAPHAGWFFAYLANWSADAKRTAGDLAHFWSLQVEEQFYLVWPVIVLALRPRAFAAIAIGLVLLAPATRVFILGMGWSPEWAYQLTLGRVDALALGGLAALAMRDEGLFARWSARLAPVGGAFTAALLVVFAASRGFGRTNPLVQTAGYSLLSFVFTAGVFATVLSAAKGGRLARALAARPLRVLGTYSYGVYVFHLPLLVALRDGFGIDLAGGSAGRRIVVRTLFTAAVLIGSLGGAVLSYHLFEKRFLDLKRYFVARAGPDGAASGPKPRRADARHEKA
jgi:peptidoglycan/LPS O-acetylase OafA/YrhL